MHALRVEGPDRVGLGADITRAVAAAGVNVRGSSAATIGRKNVFYLAFRTAEEALTATRSIRRALARKR
jgi:predicted amino acid-binding ACT domain protein